MPDPLYEPTRFNVPTAPSRAIRANPGKTWDFHFTTPAIPSPLNEKCNRSTCRVSKFRQAAAYLDFTTHSTDSLSFNVIFEGLDLDPLKRNRNEVSSPDTLTTPT